MLIFHLLPSTEIYSSGLSELGPVKQTSKGIQRLHLHHLNHLPLSLSLSFFLSLPLRVSLSQRRSGDQTLPSTLQFASESSKLVSLYVFNRAAALEIIFGIFTWKPWQKMWVATTSLESDSIPCDLPCRACGSVQGARCCLAPPVTSDLHRSSAGHFENLWSPADVSRYYPVWSHTHLYCWCVENGIPKSPRN